MIKSTLIERLAAKMHHLSVQEVTDGVNFILEMLSTNLSRGNRIEIRGFGSFSPRYVAARNAHNPKTGKRLVTSAKHRTHFKAGKELRERVDTQNKAPFSQSGLFASGKGAGDEGVNDLLDLKTSSTPDTLP